MEMPKPSSEHRMLEMLVGNWEGNERMYPSQWDQAGGVAIGRTQNRLAVGGFAVITDYEQERDGAITFSGHGVYTYDPKQKLYLLYWLDSMGSPPEVFTGIFAEKVLTLSHGGPPMHVRLTWNLTQSDLIESKMEMSEDGITWKKLFDAEYRRLR